MIKRTGYTLTMAWKHRKMLKAYRYNTKLQIPSILHCDVNLLKADGIKAVILDVDGVLVSYRGIVLDEKIDSWLNLCIKTFGEGNVFILTNYPTQSRHDYFLQRFKGIQVLLPSKKKPYPEGIEQALQRLQIDPAELLLIDDRLLTGILAASISKVSALYITDPLINFTQYPLQELFFLLLRKIEKFLV